VNTTGVDQMDDRVERDQRPDDVGEREPVAQAGVADEDRMAGPGEMPACDPVAPSS
jgi:hypothetical protein